MFDKDYNQALITAVIDGHKINITKKGINEKEVKISEELLPTSQQNIYYFKGIELQKLTQRKNDYYVCKLDKPNRLLQIFADTTFANKNSIEKYIANPQNLILAIGYPLVSEINLEEVKSYPPITTLTKADQAKFKQMETERVAALSSIDEKKLKQTEKMKAFVKQGFIISVNCLMLGYKPPADKEEMDFLRQFIAK